MVNLNPASTAERRTNVFRNDNPYVPGHCWYAIKAMDKTERPCNSEAKEFEVRSASKNVKESNYFVCQMWLCEYHMLVLNQRKYLLTPVESKKDNSKVVPLNHHQKGT